MKRFLNYITIAVLFLPQLSWGADSTFDNSSFRSIVLSFVNIINKTLPILMLLTVIFFFWGLVTFIYFSADDKRSETGKKMMVWGVIAMFVMFCIWGIVGLLVHSVGGSFQLPQINSLKR